MFKILRVAVAIFTKFLSILTSFRGSAGSKVRPVEKSLRICVGLWLASNFIILCICHGVLPILLRVLLFNESVNFSTNRLCFISFEDARFCAYFFWTSCYCYSCNYMLWICGVVSELRAYCDIIFNVFISNLAVVLLLV